jgi:hypothetical protein
MKRLLLVSCALVLSACSMFRTEMPPPAPAPVRSAPVGLVDANGAPIERIPFRAGVSSVTVERLGKNQACASNQGAGLVTETRLNLADLRARKYLATQMEKHFFGDGADVAQGYVPPSA